jgi:hypothetical protein
MHHQWGGGNMLSRPEGLLTQHNYPFLNKAQHLLKQINNIKKPVSNNQENKWNQSITNKGIKHNSYTTQQLMTSGYSLGLGPAERGA